MQTSGVINALPLWALYIFTATIVLLSDEAGWRLGSYRRKRSEQEIKAPIGGIVGAILGVLSFLLAFTFGMGATRFDTHKQVVLQETNAIGTAYLRADLLPEPQRTDVRNGLREYTTLRAKGLTWIMTPEVMAQSAALQDRLWADAVAVGTESPNSIVVGLFIQSLNEVIDLEATRLTAGRNRIPDSIWFMLYAVTVLAMIGMGYQFGLNGVRSWPTTILMVLIFTSIIVLISDLDRPQAGLVQMSQQAMIDLLNKMGAPVP